MNDNIQTTYKDLPVSELRKEEQGQVVGIASLCPGSDNPAATAASRRWLLAAQPSSPTSWVADSREVVHMDESDPQNQLQISVQ